MADVPPRTLLVRMALTAVLRLRSFASSTSSPPSGASGRVQRPVSKLGGCSRPGRGMHRAMTEYSEQGALPVEDGLTEDELDEAWREAQQNPNLADEERAARRAAGHPEKSVHDQSPDQEAG